MWLVVLRWELICLGWVYWVNNAKVCQWDSRLSTAKLVSMLVTLSNGPKPSGFGNSNCIHINISAS